MGTDWSTETQNEEIKPKKLQHDYQEEAKEKQTKICNEVQKQMEEQNRQFQETLNAVQESIETDNSVPNLVDNYAKLRTIMPPNVHALGDFVDKMKDGWSGIMAQLDAIREYGDEGDEKAKNMERLHLNYWRLLLKTRSKIQLIMTRCKIQKLNITRLLSILKDARNPDKTVSADDKLAYQDCINCLLMWLRSDNVQSIMEEWKKMTNQLLQAKQDWQSLVRSIAKSSWKYTWQCFGVVAQGSCIVLAILAVAGVAILASEDPNTVCAAFNVMRDIDHDGMLGTVGIATAWAIGASILTGVQRHIRRVKQYFDQAATLHYTAVKMQERLEILLKQSVKMEEKLSAVDDVHGNTSVQVDFMKDLKSYQMMASALKDLEGYLDEYMNQGTKVMQIIQESAEKFINV
eukprot:398368_1